MPAIICAIAGTARSYNWNDDQTLHVNELRCFFNHRDHKGHREIIFLYLSSPISVISLLSVI